MKAKSVKTLSAAGFLVIMTFVVTLQAFATGDYEPKVTLNRSNANLEETLIEINKQTGYSFSAKSELLSTAKPFNINVKDVTVQHALEVCFKNQPLTYVIKDYTIIIKEKVEDLHEKGNDLKR